MELLVVMAILSIMTGVLFVSVGDSSKKDAEVAAQQISAQLKALQNEALTGKRIEVPANSGTFISACYFVFDTTALTSYKVSYLDCSAAPQPIGSDLIVDLKKKKVTVDAHTIVFTSPRGEVSGNDSDVVISSTKDPSVKKFVNMSSAGSTATSDTNLTVTCTSWTYSDWGTCQADSTQTRTITSSSPVGCTGGNPAALSQGCVYVPPVETCTSWTYSAWGACQPDNTQTRTITSSSPVGCTGGTPESLTQSCTYVAPAGIWNLQTSWYIGEYCESGAFTPLAGTSCTIGEPSRDEYINCTDQGDDSYCCDRMGGHLCQ